MARCRNLCGYRGFGFLNVNFSCIDFDFGFYNSYRINVALIRFRFGNRLYYMYSICGLGLSVNTSIFKHMYIHIFFRNVIKMNDKKYAFYNNMHTLYVI